MGMGFSLKEFRFGSGAIMLRAERKRHDRDRTDHALRDR
jgi:hypothetical protein